MKQAMLISVALISSVSSASTGHAQTHHASPPAQIACGGGPIPQNATFASDPSMNAIAPVKGRGTASIDIPMRAFRHNVVIYCQAWEKGPAGWCRGDGACHLNGSFAKETVTTPTLTAQEPGQKVRYTAVFSNQDAYTGEKGISLT